MIGEGHGPVPPPLGSATARDKVQNFTSREIPSERLIQTTNFVHGLAPRSTNLQMIICPLSGRDQGHLTHSRISYPLKYLRNG